MTFVVLFLLAVVWAIYLATWLRNRSEHRSVNSITSFNKHLSVLERTSPARFGRSPAPARSGLVGGYALGRSRGMSLGQARRRRRDVLFALVGLALVTLVAAVVVGGSFVYLQLLADVLLVGYVGMLVRARRLAEDRQAKVRYLQPHAPVARHVAAAPAEAPYFLPRSASANY